MANLYAESNLKYKTFSLRVEPGNSTIKLSNDLIADNDLPKEPSKFKLDSGDTININTDLISVKINTLGGDIRELKFNNHLSEDSKDKYLLMTVT